MDALDTTIFSQVTIEQPFVGLRVETLWEGLVLLQPQWCEEA